MQHIHKRREEVLDTVVIFRLKLHFYFYFHVDIHFTLTDSVPTPKNPSVRFLFLSRERNGPVLVDWGCRKSTSHSDSNTRLGWQGLVVHHNLWMPCTWFWKPTQDLSKGWNPGHRHQFLEECWAWEFFVQWWEGVWVA